MRPRTAVTSKGALASSVGAAGPRKEVHLLSCRLRDLPPHPARALHGLHPAVQWTPLCGTYRFPALFHLLSSHQEWGGRGKAEAQGGGDRPGPSPLSAHLCFPLGSHGAAGHGQHHQLVAVSLATVCGSWRVGG